MSNNEEQSTLIKDPLVIMYEQDEQIICRIHQLEKYTHEHYGMFICDLVRHIARAYEVDEELVWEWVDKERDHPTTELTRPS